MSQVLQAPAQARAQLPDIRWHDPGTLRNLLWLAALQPPPCAGSLGTRVVWLTLTGKFHWDAFDGPQIPPLKRDRREALLATSGPASPVLPDATSEILMYGSHRLPTTAFVRIFAALRAVSP